MLSSTPDGSTPSPCYHRAVSSPFDSIESAQEYIGLLTDAAGEAVAAIAEDIARTSGQAAESREMDALRLVEYKLTQLQHHLASSRRLLNDLRTLRRLILSERREE